MADELGHSDNHGNIKPLKRHAQLFRRKLLIFSAIEIQVQSSSITNRFHMVDLLVTCQQLFSTTRDYTNLVESADQHPKVLIGQALSKSLLYLPRRCLPLSVGWRSRTQCLERATLRRGLSEVIALILQLPWHL